MLEKEREKIGFASSSSSIFPVSNPLPELPPAVGLAASSSGATEPSGSVSTAKTVKFFFFLLLLDRSAEAPPPLPPDLRRVERPERPPAASRTFTCNGRDDTPTRCGDGVMVSE